MILKVDLTVDCGDEAYADACAYFRYQYGEVPAHLLSEPDEPDYAETVLNAVEAVITDLVGSYDELPVSDWAVTASSVATSGWLLNHIREVTR